MQDLLWYAQPVLVLGMAAILARELWLKPRSSSSSTQSERERAPGPET